MTQERRDRLGRRIGRNWWREFIMDQWSSEDAAWHRLRSSGAHIHTDVVPGADYDTGFHQLSEDEFKMIRPRPTLKGHLIRNAGLHTES